MSEDETGSRREQCREMSRLCVGVHQQSRYCSQMSEGRDWAQWESEVSPHNTIIKFTEREREGGGGRAKEEGRERI